MTATAPDHLRDVEQRLSEANATIEALVSGQIDAVVDSRSATPVLLARAQDALRESETRFHDERDRAQRYLDTAGVILLALDTEGRVTLVNRFACDLLGWSAEELIGRAWIECCMPHRIRERLQAQFQHVVAGERSIVEAEVVTRSGKERLIEWRNTLVHDDAGQVVGTFSSGTDITERAQALEALRATEERKRFALASANVGIWDADLVTGVTHWSDTLLAQYGLSAGSFGGTIEAFIALVHPDDRAAVQAAIGASMKTGADFFEQHRAVRPDGTIRWLHGTGRVVLDDRGEPVRATGISQDVTESRALQLQFQQAQKMEAVGRLASGVAHDFNNMLSVILGWSMMAQDEIPPEHPVREALEEVIKAAQSAAGLTKQLLAFSRQQLVEPTVFDPNTLVHDVDRMLQRVIGEDIELVTHTSPDAGFVKMDRAQLEQVLMNLVVNARDAMPDGGRLTIETTNVVLDADYPTLVADLVPGEYVMLAVSDTGAGMTEAVKAKIFEPFFTTKERDKGTGLGLATCYGVIKQAGGHIVVYTELGIGTTMKVYLPLRRDAAVTKVPAKAAALRGTETILLVEDDTAVRRVTTRMLVAQGYRVLSAASGEEALNLLSTGEEPIHLLLTDVVLSRGMNGRVLAERAVALFPQLPVVFASGYTNDVAILHGMMDEGIVLVQKPFTAQSLGRKVRDMLDRVR